MKRFLLIVFILTIPIFARAEITYRVSEAITQPNTLVVNVARTPPYSATSLQLRGVQNGVSEQIENMVCDKIPLTQHKAGHWEVPIGCRNIEWEVPLKTDPQLASSQQSIKYKNFILFSEASSLPRLTDANEEKIKVSLQATDIYPEATTTLPNEHAPPLFVLINPQKIDAIHSSNIDLTYFADDNLAARQLPDITHHLKALIWFHLLLPSDGDENFVIQWLAVPSDKISLAGATGDNVLLINYPQMGENPFGKAMLLYVALHEAFHQLSKPYPAQPTWVAESLSSYYGVRGLQHVTDNKKQVDSLLKKFLASGEHFQNGLITINHHVAQGDRSEYAAFYTKGIAFWIAVNKALQSQHDSLDNHLAEIFKTQYDADGKPQNLSTILRLSPEVWKTLETKYLN